MSLGISLAGLALLVLLIFCWRTEGCLLYNMRTKNKKKQDRLNRRLRDKAGARIMAQLG